MKNLLSFTIASIIMALPIHANIPSWVGDVVARDLRGVGPVGHVGIASNYDVRQRPYFVLEAMNTVPHIQQNSIKDFKSRSPYWGSKGGLVSPRSPESFEVANRIVRQYYACPEYTLLWRWREGEIDSGSFPIKCAKFRCDTLVNYAYAFSDAYSLPTYNTAWTTPVGVYNYFPVNSDLFSPQSPMKQPSTKKSLLITGCISSINESNVTTLTDNDFYQILTTSPNISQEQLMYLWQLFTSNEISPKVKMLFYDFISSEDPQYLTTDIIRQAKKERGKLRHQLLVALQSIYQKSLRSNQKQGLKEIADYFIEIQHQHLNKDDGGIVERGIATLRPEQSNVNNSNLTNMDKIHVNIIGLKNDPVNELKYVNDIIYNLDHPDDSLVVTASYQYLTLLLIQSELKFFSNKSKQLFKTHLNNKSLSPQGQTIVYPSAYIEFKAALNAKTIEEIPSLAYQYLQLLDPELKETAPYSFTRFTKKRLKIINNHN